MSKFRGPGHRMDGNHGEIVAALCAAGCAVLDLSAVGDGMPDILVHHRGKLFLIEIKNKATRGKLNKRQQAFVDEWPAPVYVAYTAEQALAIVGAFIGIEKPRPVKRTHESAA